MRPMHQLLSVTLLFFQCGLVPAAFLRPHVGCRPDQAAALLQLKHSFQEPHLPLWRRGTDCCSWEGVSCAGGGGGRVTSLDLGDRGLRSGALDPAVFRLTSLRRLILAGNDFRGSPLPAAGFERLAGLTHLDLSDAGFAGRVPLGVGRLRSLVSLDLSTSGDQPAPLAFQGATFRAVAANLSNLRALRLDGVDMSGAALSDATPRLEVLSLAGCGLSGAVPDSLADFSRLRVLRLSDNDFRGSFPRRVMQLETLRELNLSSNYELSGSLPDFAPGSALEILDLSNTDFSGGIPSSMRNLGALKALDLGSSRFSVGELPSWIGRLESLAVLGLRECGVSGQIPASVANLSRLAVLNLADNNLTG